MSASSTAPRPRLLAVYVSAVIAAGGAVVLHSLQGVGEVSNPAAWAGT